MYIETPLGFEYKYPIFITQGSNGVKQSSCILL